ncbi:Cytochrome P450 87A3, partial [Cucurbita argyrosperma subsp. sororia]
MWVVLIASVVVLVFTKWVHSWRRLKHYEKLPKGSMGFPLLGENLEFLTPHSSFDIAPFIKTRMVRYGPIFRTNLMGRPTIVSTDTDLNHLIFQEEGNLFRSWYPDRLTKIFGRQNILSMHGQIFKSLKNMIMNLYGFESMKKMVREVEASTKTRLKRWSSRNMIDLKDETATMIFDFTSKKLISYDRESSSENLRENFDVFIKGLISLPLNFLGTAHHKCRQGRKRTMKMLKNMLQERQANPRKQHNDFFDYVLEELEKHGTLLTQEMALDLMFFLLFASFETTSLALTLAIKFLVDHPRVLTELTVEHEGILKNRDKTDSGLTWAEYKSMTFTFQFINETLRLGNVAPLIFREALKDVEYKGFVIPAGWIVVPSLAAVHLNPENYVDPLAFNPWRWEKSDGGASKHLMAFGGGLRFCFGAEFVKLQIAVFLHSLLTSYKFEAIKGGNISREPGLQFPDGFHVRITEKSLCK